MLLVVVVMVVLVKEELKQQYILGVKTANRDPN